MIARTEEAADVKIPIVDLTSPNAAKGLLDAAINYGFIFLPLFTERCDMSVYIFASFLL